MWSLGNLISILIYSAFLYQFLVLPFSFFNGIMYLVIFLLTGSLATFINLIVGFIAFWTGEASHIKLATNQVIALLSGALLPLSYYPKQIQTILNYLPFKYLIQFPADVYLGKTTNNEIFTGITIMCFWILFLYLLAEIVYKKGVKIYESYN